MTFKPSSRNCRGCEHLVWETHAGRRRRICDIVNRIPGNLSECPDLEADEPKNGPVLHNSINPYNSLRYMEVTHFNDKICTDCPYGRGEVQEIVSSIVKAARLNGYQIPEA